jgi:hypothetical protein
MIKLLKMSEMYCTRCEIDAYASYQILYSMGLTSGVFATSLVKDSHDVMDVFHNCYINIAAIILKWSQKAFKI